MLVCLLHLQFTITCQLGSLTLHDTKMNSNRKHKDSIVVTHTTNYLVLEYLAFQYPS